MADQSDRPEPDHTEDPRRQDTADAGYAETAPEGTPRGRRGASRGRAARRQPAPTVPPSTSAPEEGDPGQATGNPDVRRRRAARADLGEGRLRGACGRSSSPPRTTARRRATTLATAQDIPLKFLENILADLRHAGLVRSQRGAEGGYWLARPAEEITVADIIRAVEGPLASVRGERPEDVELRRHRRAAAAGVDRGAREPARRSSST